MRINQTTDNYSKVFRVNIVLVKVTFSKKVNIVSNMQLYIDEFNSRSSLVMSINYNRQHDTVGNSYI